MRAQSSSSISETPAPPVRRRINPVVVDGLAAILSKAGSVLRGEPLQLWANVSPEDQRELLLDARAAINAQDPAKSRHAVDAAAERAEIVMAETWSATPQALEMARRIATEAVLAYRLDLQGSFDQQGGVQ